MKISHLPLILIAIIFLFFSLGHAYADNLNDTNNIEIQNILVQPTTIKAGDNFTVAATLVNNSPNTIYVGHGACEAPFSVTFDSHVQVDKNNIFCTLQIIEQRLDHGAKMTATSPYLDLVYHATGAGNTNATITFRYGIWDQATQSNIEKTVSKSFQFAISDQSGFKSGNVYGPGGPAVGITLDPLQQFKSGIDSENTRCYNGYALVIKSEDGSPACVLLDTGTKLMERGWAKQIITNQTVEPSSQILSQTKPEDIAECDVPYEWKQNMMPVMFMPTNSVGKMCVQYQSGYATKIGLGFFDATPEQNASKSITVYANPNLIPEGNSTVVFTIRTGNQTGLFGAELFCVGMPFAVGYDNQSNITQDNFPWMKSHTIECPMAIYTNHVLGLHGIGIKYVPYTSEN